MQIFSDLDPKCSQVAPKIKISNIKIGINFVICRPKKNDLLFAFEHSVYTPLGEEN